MTSLTADLRKTGLAGPVAVFGGVLLLLAGPVLRGGHRAAPAVVLETLALLVLAAVAMRHALSPIATPHGGQRPGKLLWFVLLSPMAIALLQLTPIPAAWWAQWPGRKPFALAAQEIGIGQETWRALSLSPDLTRASLLGALPLAASCLLGFMCSIHQLRLVLRFVAGLCVLQVGLALLQASGGQHSPFYMGAMTYGAPIGSLPNRNLFANFIAMGLVAYVWLAYDATRYSLRLHAWAPLRTGTFDVRHAIAAWVAGGLLLVLGVLMSRSRGGAIFGLGAAFLAMSVAGLRVFGWTRGWKFASAIGLLALVAGGSLLGLDSIVARIGGSQLGESGSFRWALTQSSLDAARAFLPLGSGWGTYELAYPRFQPASIAHYVDYAHNDYVQMLVEGGLAFLLPAGCFAWLAISRAAWLVRTATRHRRLGRDAMAAALCGIGLLGFLLHAIVDFPMRIPANAILAAFLAGAFLRPLQKGEAGPPATHP